MPCVLLDSVQAQANRLEEALQRALDSGLLKGIPVLNVDFTGLGLLDEVGRVSSLEAPHRIADAILRDSLHEGQPFRKSELGKSLDQASLQNATPLYKLCPTALIFGLWDSTGPKVGLGAKFQRALVLDRDLALIYGVDTRVFNQAFQRNRHRFPVDFAFQLQAEEWASLRSQIVTLKTGRGQHRKYLPWVFTEHGALMAASILNSERAVAMSVYIVRAFVKMRRELLADATLEARFAKIDQTLLSHDTALRDLFAKLRPLLLPPPEPSRRRIGFHRKEDKA